MIKNLNYKQLEPNLKAIMDAVPADTRNVLINNMLKISSRVSELQAKGYKTPAQLSGEIVAGKIKPREGSIKTITADGSRTGLTRFVKDEKGRELQITKFDDLPGLLISDGETSYIARRNVVPNYHKDEVFMYKDITGVSDDNSYYKYAGRMVPAEIAKRVARSGNALEMRIYRGCPDKAETLKEVVEKIRKVDKQ